MDNDSKGDEKKFGTHAGAEPGNNTIRTPRRAKFDESGVKHVHEHALSRDDEASRGTPVRMETSSPMDLHTAHWQTLLAFKRCERRRL